jgi:hypothetical protein
MQDFQTRQRSAQLVGAGLGDIRLADVQPPQAMQALQESQPGIGDPGVAELQRLQTRHPFSQVFEARIGYSCVEEIERGQAAQPGL